MVEVVAASPSCAVVDSVAFAAAGANVVAGRFAARAEVAESFGELGIAVVAAIVAATYC